MKKIAVFQSDLGVGGIQKSLINLLRNIDYSRVRVDLYLSQRGEGDRELFPAQLNIKYLEPVPRIFSFLPFDMARRLMRRDFSALGSYDLAIDFNSYQFSCAVGALGVSAARRVMWVHNDVEIKLRDEWKYRVLWKAFKGKFKYYDEFACVSKALIAPFKKMSHMEDKAFRVIPNFVDAAEIRERMNEVPAGLELDEACVNFVAVGRLCHQKGYDLMLDIFSKACDIRSDLRLYIIGGGEEQEALERLRDSLGLGGKVFFLGSQNNPYCYMSRMDAFISTSRYEGQGINIMEAKVIGLPVYCPKHLEKYIDGLTGCEDMTAAITGAKKTAKQPNDLEEYNRSVLDGIYALADSVNK